MISLYLALGCFVFAVIGAYLNFSRNSKELVRSPKVSLGCKLHDWKEAILLSPKESELYLKDSKFSKLPSLYCTACGYVPALDLEIKPEMLALLKEKQKRREEFLQDTKDISDLKAEWLGAHTKTILLDEQIAFFTQGYEAYDRFVEALPDLLEQRRLHRIWAQFKKETK